MNYTFAYQRSGSVDEGELREIFDQVLGEPSGGAQSQIDSMIDSALNSTEPAFVVLYEGCLPCQAGTTIDNLEQENYDENHTYGDLIAFIRVNITQQDDPQAVKDEFNVTQSPTMLLITGKDQGNYTVAYQQSGSVNTTELREAFNQVLGESSGGAQSAIDLMIDNALNSTKPAFVVFYEGCLPCQLRAIED
jgi:hypothetical protein